MLTSLTFVVQYCNYYPIRGLDEWVSVWDDDPVFNVLNFYAQMKLFKVLHVIFQRIHFTIFKLKKVFPFTQLLAAQLPLII